MKLRIALFFYLVLINSYFLACQNLNEIKWKNFAYSLGARKKLKLDFYNEINALLDQGIDPNLKLTISYQDTMLSRAVEHDTCSDIVALLLSKGASAVHDTHWTTPLHHDMHWTTPLHIAARNKAFANLELLLPFVNAVNQSDDAHKSALDILMIEAYWDKVDYGREAQDYLPIIRAFIKKGARPIVNQLALEHYPIRSMAHLVQQLDCPEIEELCRDGIAMPFYKSLNNIKDRTYFALLQNNLLKEVSRYITAEEYV